MDFRGALNSVKELRGKKPAVVAMTLLASPTGMKIVQGAMKTKAKVDRNLREVWDFLGVPSFSDHDKVERTIGKVQGRFRDVEADLDRVSWLVDELESAVESASVRPTMPASKPVLTTKETHRDPASLTRGIDLLKPKPARRSAPKPVAPVTPPTKSATPTKPLLTEKPKSGSAASMLDLRLKKA
ncbi:MAG: hypothetical protein IT350_16100 [Deltaproteobacteria bacterium]|nr:hypothetical protein [Deltaproteobacteria bacterium]